MDIFDQLGLGDIPGMKEFQAIPTTLEIVPVGQRVREFLNAVAGAAWLSARVSSYAMPGGATTHLAFIRSGFVQGTAMIVVAESLDGSLSLPFSTSDGEDQGQCMQFL